MKLRTKIFAPLFVVLMLGMATSAFADLACTISVLPAAVVARDTLNGHMENTADLTFVCTAPNNNPTTEGSFTVVYPGLTITNNTTTVATGHLINVVDAPATVPGSVAFPGTSSGAAMGDTGAAMDISRTDTIYAGANSGIHYTNGVIAITIPAEATPAATCTPSCAFSLNNVLVSLAGGTTAGQSVSVSANVVSNSGNITLTGAPLVVINQVLPMLNSTTNPPALAAPVVGQPAVPAQFTASGAVLPATASCPTVACQNARASFSVTVSEDHVDSWRTAAQYYTNGVGTGNNGTNVLFTFAGMLPGSQITNCVITPPAGTTWLLTGSGIAGSAGTTTLVAELVAGPTNMTLIETLQLTCGTSTTNPAYLAGASTGAAATPITVSMSAFPTGNALSGFIGVTAAPGNTGGVPRYAASGAVGPLVVINFVGGVSGQTTMLIPWVTASGAAAPPAGTFNTGVTIANTTKDPAPFGTDAQGAATDTAGNISFYFFPADGSASFTVTPTTGFGLQSGVIPSGGTFIGNFSDILKAGNQTGTFSGYVFAVANFTHAHGSAFVYGGSAAERITSAQDVLVIGNPSTFSRNTNFGAEPQAEITSR